MGELEHIQAGMSVYRADGQEIGKVRAHWGASLYVNNEPIPVEMVDLVLDQGVFLKGNYTGPAHAGDTSGTEGINVAARAGEAVIARESAVAALSGD